MCVCVREALTHAAISTGLARVSRGTDAHVCTNQVLAGHPSAGTVIYTVFTLILVWGAKRGTLSLRSAGVTSAYVHVRS